MALLEFLQLVEPSTQPLDSKFDAELINFTTAIEIFAVAHEYGHLIKNHTLQGTKSLKFNLISGNENRDAEVNVGVRSWQQELEADKIGIQLLTRVLENNVADNRTSFSRRAAELRQIYSLYGVLFYFKCSEIVEKSKYILEFGYPPPALSQQEANAVREFALSSTGTQITEKHLPIDLKNHPPSWLRLEYAQNEIDKYLQTNKFTKESRDYSRLGLGLVENLDVLWGLSLPRLPMIIDVINNKIMPTELGYVQSPSLWQETFMYNPKLAEAIAEFKKKDSHDSTVIKKYYNAIDTDWLLLSGLQGRWAIEQLSENNSNDKRTEALSVVALSGTKQHLKFLKQIDTSIWSESEKLLWSKANRFLETYGRNTSLDVLIDTPAEKFDLNALLSYPTLHNGPQFTNFKIPEKVDLNVVDYLRDNKAIGPGSSLSAMALYMVTANTTLETQYNFWSDLLLKYGKIESALEYANNGIKKAGSSAFLENAVGNILTSQGNLSDAITHYKLSLTLGRIDGWPEMNIAKNYSKLGELVQAEDWFRQALLRSNTARSKTEFAEYLNEFSWFLVTHYRNDKSCVQEALTLSIVSNKIVKYSDPNFLDTFAECLASNGDLKNAVKMSKAALELIPEDSSEVEKYKDRLIEFSNLSKKIAGSGSNQGKSTKKQ